jgi:hypothetical protein
MADDKQFIDPLEELMARNESIMNPNETPAAPADAPEEEDIFGVNDQANEMAAEDAAREEARKAHQQELAEAAEAIKPTVQLPPQSLDPKFQKDAIEFQGNKLDIVGDMIQKAIAKMGITGGGIPEEVGNDVNYRRKAMGDLIEYYEMNGEEITDEFCAIIKKYWRYDDGNNIDQEAAKEAAETQEAIEAATDTAIAAPEPTPEINIHVDAGVSDVTVNIDENLVKDMSEEQRVNVRVIKTTQEEMRTAKVVLNSQRNDIITPFKSTANSVPLALPLSGYRCCLTPLSYWEFIQLSSEPTSGNRVDMDKKQWSIIYKHITNVSIGDFANFEDFLKKTKYADRELLMWGILLSASDDVETATVVCGNPKCREPHEIKYIPQKIIHINDELANQHEYKVTGSVAPGKPAIEHFNKINSTIKMYELPHTKYLVEIEARPSAYDFLNRRYPLMDELRERFKSENQSDEDFDESNNAEYGYLLFQALFITAISKVVDGQTYRYTNWEDIEKIITTSLDMNDAGILFSLIKQVAEETRDPIQFYIEDVTCEKCGRHEKRIMIPDVGQSLLFQLSQRLSSTAINLTEMEQS